MAPAVPLAHRPIVISGPSGSGKSTILKRLFEAYPSTFGFSVSHTTRSPRSGEIDGREYNFTTRDEFLRLVAENGFLEHAQFGGNYYGTSIKAVRDVAEKGKVCVLDIEMEGVKQVQASDLNARILFLYPPSIAELEDRLRRRGTETEDSLQKRLQQAEVEMVFAKEASAKAKAEAEAEAGRGGRGAVDQGKLVVNDDLERAYAEVEEWVVDGGQFGDKS